MTTITTYKCDGCGAMLEGDPRQAGHGWRGVRTHISAFTQEDIAALRLGQGEISHEYCPKCLPHIGLKVP